MGEGERGTAPWQADQDSPAGIYYTLTRHWLLPAQRSLLKSRVVDLETWRGCVDHWLNHGWNSGNLTGLLDLYEQGGAEACRFCAEQAGKKSAAREAAFPDHSDRQRYLEWENS